MFSLTKHTMQSSFPDVLLHSHGPSAQMSRVSAYTEFKQTGLPGLTFQNKSGKNPLALFFFLNDAFLDHDLAAFKYLTMVESN